MQKIETNIISNGSKWAGEEPDSIEKLIEVLKENTIEKSFFGKYRERYREDYKPFVLCPINKRDGKYLFFGNFELLSHAFRIETNDPQVITTLKTAIMNNPGWKKYLSQCKNVK